jgi:hypothetical protein
MEDELWSTDAGCWMDMDMDMDHDLRLTTYDYGLGFFFLFFVLPLLFPLLVNNLHPALCL